MSVPAKQKAGEKTPAKVEQNAPPTPAPHPAESLSKEDLQATLKALKGQQNRPYRVSVGKDSGSPHGDSVSWGVQIAEVFATRSSGFTNDAYNTLLAATSTRGAPIGSKGQTNAMGAALALIQAIDPRDELEAALAVQMAMTHEAAQRALVNASKSEMMDHAVRMGGLATKLSRTFVAQVEALSKLRNAGKQVVEVTHVHKHVHVGPGGQAIVGDVHYGAGGGASIENGGQPQPHALTDAGDAALWRQDPAGYALSGAGGGGQEALQDARRSEGFGSAERAQERPLSDGEVHEGGRGRA